MKAKGYAHLFLLQLNVDYVDTYNHWNRCQSYLRSLDFAMEMIRLDGVQLDLIPESEPGVFSTRKIEQLVDSKYLASIPRCHLNHPAISKIRNPFRFQKGKGFYCFFHGSSQMEIASNEDAAVLLEDGWNQEAVDGALIGRGLLESSKIPSNRELYFRGAEYVKGIVFLLSIVLLVIPLTNPVSRWLMVFPAIYFLANCSPLQWTFYFLGLLNGRSLGFPIGAF